MRLKSIYINQYKNLKDFRLDFDGSSFIDVFVGKNATGKSNLFEALIEIFRHIDEYDRDKQEPKFEYQIVYEIEGNETKISWKDGKLKINEKGRKTFRNVIKPDNVLIYYSGHNETVAGLVKIYEKSYRNRIKTADFDESRYFIGIGPDYKELLLSVLLIQPETCKARMFISQKLGIETIGSEVRLVLERPLYADDPRFNIEDRETDRYWNPKGITYTFLDRLSKCIITASAGPVREEGYLPEQDRYILYFNIAKIQEEFDDYSPQVLFRQFDNLKTLGMLTEISIPLKLTGGVDAKISHFSDGQFQSIYIYTISELFKDRNCITLLDEPDCFLHPEWQFEFLKQIFEITETAEKSNHVLMSSHSAVTLIPHDRDKIKFFEIQDNLVNCFDLPKTVAIKKLSSDLIRYSEQEQLLSIINAVQIEHKPVLFTEGSNDPIIIKEAWYKLYDDEIPFIPFYGFGCAFIKVLLTDGRIHSEMGGLPIFGLFDFDQAYNQWNDIKGEVIEVDPMQGMIKKWEHGESYAIMLPIPHNTDIQSQVIRDHSTGETYCSDSRCEIEHLFYGLCTISDYFELEPSPGGNVIVFKSDHEKTKFAKEIVPLLDATPFQVFRPMFEFIKNKC